MNNIIQNIFFDTLKSKFDSVVSDMLKSIYSPIKGFILNAVIGTVVVHCKQGIFGLK